MASLTLFIDIISPFTYFAFKLLQRQRAALAASSVTVSYVPIYLGGIMAATGNRPPITITNKGPYTQKDVGRMARLFSIPLYAPMPPNFPINTIKTMRVLLVIQREFDSDTFEAAIDKLYEGYWKNGFRVDEEPEIVKALKGVLKETEVERVLEESRTEEVKSALKEQTAKCVEGGAFGLPWFVTVNKEGKEEKWWGVDRIGLALGHVGVDFEKIGDVKSLL